MMDFCLGLLGGRLSAGGREMGPRIREDNGGGEGWGDILSR